MVQQLPSCRCHKTPNQKECMNEKDLRVEPGAHPPSRNLKRDRDWSSSGSEDDDLVEMLISERKPVWAVERLHGLKMKLKKRRVSSVLPEHHKAFTNLLENPVVKRFLAWDRDLLVSDKYLLAMVIAYFSRSGLSALQYRPIHFFLALYLASDMEEDMEDAKQDIFKFLYGETNAPHRTFHKLRFQLFRSMGYRAWVSREECEEIQAYNPDLWVWKRDRSTLSQNPSAKEACGNWRERDHCLWRKHMGQRKSKLTLRILKKGERSGLYRKPRRTKTLLEAESVEGDENQGFHFNPSDPSFPEAPPAQQTTSPPPTLS
uniref:speedy protein E4-like n=1 Tax=Jaculus jaculus TaxID=51337 RepID=UPI001E1B43D7|nr:speedy protein E4-like [Jaculus jaculus]